MNRHKKRWCVTGGLGASKPEATTPYKANKNSNTNLTPTQQASPQSNVSTKILRCIWYAIHWPDGGRHQATLEALDDPTVNKTLATIEGGYKAMAAAASAGGPVADLLDLAWNYEPPAGLLKMLKERSIAAELLEQATGKEAVMVLPAQPYFIGSFPSAGSSHTCRHHVKAQETPDGRGMYYQKRTAKLWRSRMIGGQLMGKCEACYHERAWRLCQQIVKEAEHYPVDAVPLRVVELPDTKELKKLVNRARQWRKTHSIDFRYIAFPQQDGRVFVIHNQPDHAGGHELPGTKERLHALVSEWAETPEGKRISTSVGWGGSFQGIKGDGRKAEEQETAVCETEQRQQENPFDLPQEPIAFEIESHSKLAMMLEHEHGITLHGKGRLDIPPVELSLLMDTWNIGYQVTSGNERFEELRKDFTPKVHPRNNKSAGGQEGMYLMRETPQPPPETPAPKWEPEPLYLNGGWIK